MRISRVRGPASAALRASVVMGIAYLVVLANRQPRPSPGTVYCDVNVPMCTPESLGGAQCGDIPFPCDERHYTVNASGCGSADNIYRPNNKVHCGCPPAEECESGQCAPKVDATRITLDGDTMNLLNTATFTSVSCDSSSVYQQVDLNFDSTAVPALAGQTSFNWHVSQGSMTLETMDGTTIYQNVSDIVFPVLPEAAFPTPSGDVCAQSAETMCTNAIVMTSTDPTKYPGTVTASGQYVCPGTMHETDDGGTGPVDMAASGPPPVITNVPDPAGFPGTEIEIDGTNLADFTGMEKVTFGGVPITQPIDYNGFGGSNVGVIVPDGAPNGPIVWTNKNGSSTWPGPFRVEYTPVISSYSPSSGPSGTVVDFTGTHFENIDPVMGGYVDSGTVDGMGHPVAVTNISATTARIIIPAITPTNGTSCMMTLSLHNIPPGGMSTTPVNFLLTGCP